jgi:hypothetical protein
VPDNRGDGWIGREEEVLFYLDVVGADRTADGKSFILRSQGAGVVNFMGIPGQDMVVAGDVEYFTHGKPCNLAAGLRSTSYGLAVKVY